MNIYELLRSSRGLEIEVRLRQLPSQPEGTPPDVVFVGSDIGNVPYSGVKPHGGDLISARRATERLSGGTRSRPAPTSWFWMETAPSGKP